MTNLPQMRILLVSRNWHPFLGGVETQNRLIAQELAGRHDISVAAARFGERRLSQRLEVVEDTVLLPSVPSHDEGPLRVHSLAPTPTERIRLAPIALRALPRLGGHEGLIRCGYQAYRSVYVPRLRALMRGVDVVHSVWSDYLGWAAEEAARAEGVPFVLSTYVHPGQYGDDPGNVAFYQRADLALSLLESDRDKLVGLGVPEEKVRLSGVFPLLPGTSDPEGFRAAQGLGGSPCVLFVGRMVEYKGPRALLRAARYVWDQMPDVHFLFAGPAGDEALSWFDELDDRRLRYLGVVSEQEKADALAACDIFSMPSKYEVLPAVYLEAWSYAKPVVAGTAHGIPELVEGHGAGVSATQDPETLARALLDLLRDDERRRAMGERGRELVHDRFSKHAVVSAVEDAYREATERREVTDGR